MPLKMHIETGLIIKAILQSSVKPFGVNQNLNHVRSTLEDWMCIEFRNTFPEDFDVIAVYYGARDETNEYVDKATTSKALIGLLEDVKQMIGKHYPDCEPLRKQISKLNRCIKIINQELSKSQAA